MKRKAFPILLCFLICLSLVGVGFAGWVITGSDEEIISDGKIKVESVTDNRYAITAVGWVDSKSIFNFVGAADAEVSNPWLTFDTEETVNLSVTYKFKVTKGGAAYKEGTAISAKATFATELLAEIKQETGMIKLGGDLTLVDDAVNLNIKTVSAEEGIYSVTLTLAWGEKFGGVNPYSYYNKLASVTDTVKSEAFDALKALYDLNTKNVTIIITAQ